ncbi:MAG: DUF998 domain-containing protein [Uliginosibacterium sp.]|nr:DUF998 domain-containing protein [Uliginosibacterium sp.]
MSGLPSFLRDYFSGLALCGMAGFVLIVAALHAVQPGYDARHQLMSELALGPYGGFLLAAFTSLALATACLAAALYHARAHRSMVALLGAAALCFQGAGLFQLHTATRLHVGLIAAAFVLCGLAMAGLPRALAAKRLRHPRVFSWGLGGAMAAFAALDLPIGLAQRLSAATLLIWMVIVAVQLRTLRPKP